MKGKEKGDWDDSEWLCGAEIRGDECNNGAMAKVLILYSTIDGQTLKICKRLLQQLEGLGHGATVAAIEAEPAFDLLHYDTIVIGASIRYGHHHPALFDFVRRHEKILNAKNSAFFSVNVVARKPNKNRPETNPYLQKFLKQISWQPTMVAVFAGKVDYQRYRFWDRQMIRMIMWLTDGPTDLHTVVEFTDWDAVDEFGRRIGGQ